MVSVFIYYHCACGHAFAMVCVLKAQDKVQASNLSFHHEGPWTEWSHGKVWNQAPLSAEPFFQPLFLKCKETKLQKIHKDECKHFFHFS